MLYFLAATVTIEVSDILTNIEFFCEKHPHPKSRPYYTLPLYIPDISSLY